MREKERPTRRAVDKVRALPALDSEGIQHHRVFSTLWVLSAQFPHLPLTLAVETVEKVGKFNN